MNPYKFDIQYVVKSTAPEYYIVSPPKGELHAEKSIDLCASLTFSVIEEELTDTQEP
jgi:hypothetical protein